MAVSPTYPGVYIDEIPSGVRSITGVATSIAAFIGRALAGPEDEALLVHSFGEFERIFGGLWTESPMSYAVHQFFQAGGTSAYIVRVAASDAVTASKTLSVQQSLHLRVKSVDYNNYSVAISHGTSPAWSLQLYDAAGATVGTPISFTSASYADITSALSGNTYIELVDTSTEVPASRPDEVASTARMSFSGGTSTATAELLLPSTVSGSTATISAWGPGEWGNDIQVTVDHDTSDLADKELFNLTIEELDDDGNTVTTETFRNLSLYSTHTRYWVRILDDQSNLVEVTAEASSLSTTSLARLKTTSASALTLGANGGVITEPDIIPSSSASRTGVYALDEVDLFNLLCVPPRAFGSSTFDDTYDITASGWSTLIEYCRTRRAIAIVDAPADWSASSSITSTSTGIDSLGIAEKNAAIYFPRVKIADPLKENRLGEFAPCGVVAGTIAKTDGTRGVWKAPAGLDARISQVKGLTVTLTDAQHGDVNQLGVNVIRRLPAAGSVIWGARTLEGNDRLASEWKYLPVRRTALYIEESLYRGLQWVVFEGNDEKLWSQIRLNVTAFMHSLFRKGAFQGTSPKEAYLVKCDSETTTQTDIDNGIVNILVGFAPLKPAEFVIVQLQQLTGQGGS